MLRTLFVVAILGAGTVAALRNRFAAFLMYWWFALFRPEEWMWWDISFLRPSLMLGLILVVPSLLTGAFPNLTHPLSVGALAFLMTAVLAQANAVSPAISWPWVDYLFRLVLISLIGTTLIDTSKRFKLALAVIAGSFGFHAAKAGLASIMTGGTRFSEGLAGAFSDNNGYAVGIVMITPLLLAVAQNSARRWIRLAFYASVPLAAVAALSTFSRGGFLGLAAAAIVYALLQPRRILGLAAVAIVALPVVLFVSREDGYVERMETIQTYDETNEESALSRLHFWNVAVDMVSDNPLGVGLFSYEQAYDRYDSLDGQYGHRRSVHSSHFQVLAETGFPGAAVYLALFAYAFRCAFRIRRRAAKEELDADNRRLFLTASNALIVSMSAFLVGGAFIAMALNDLTWVSFALVAALDRISAVACTAAQQSAGAVVASASASQLSLQPAFAGRMQRSS
jgi:putative inorganic carbon (HCO3(-)) transporter